MFKIPTKFMRELGWDENLAMTAQHYADQCTFQHSHFVAQGLGENIWSAGFGNYRNSLQFMFNEVYDKQCNCTNHFKPCCGHYSQVWLGF